MSRLRLRSATLHVTCPICGSAMHATYGQVIDEETIVCAQGHRVQLVDKDDGVRHLDRSMTQLDRQFRRLGRRR